MKTGLLKTVLAIIIFTFCNVQANATNNTPTSIIKKMGACAPTTSITTSTACDSLWWNGLKYTLSGTYLDTILNTEGCDSIMTLNVTITNSSTSTTTQTSCDSLLWNGIKYTTSGTYIDTITNAAGCDSIMTLNLTINHSSTSTTTQTSCDSLWWNGVKYTTSGTYTWQGTNAENCDSTATLNLTINNSTSSTFTTSACGSYTWALNSKVYTSSNYTDTVHLTTINGCDSLINLDLTILANIASINIINSGAYCGDTAKTQLSTNIGSSFGSVSYEWSKLDYNTDTWQVAGHDSVYDVNITTPTQYVLKTTIAGCGTFWSNQQTVIPVKAATVSLTPTPTVEICNNNIVNFVASSADSGVNNFAFYQGSILVQNGASLTYNTPSLTTANSSLIYTVEATNLKPIFDGNITENFWGTPLAVSTRGPSPSFGAGQELNAVYARADNDNLYLAIAGNVQNNNRIMMFIDSKSGGYNNGDYGRNGIANNGIRNFNAGNIFDPGFDADYCLGIGTDATRSQFYFDLVEMKGNATTGTSVNNYFGSNLSPASGYSIGANPVNNSQTNGFEIAIPKSALGYINGNIRVFLMYSGDNGFLSNQFLTRANTGAGSYGNGIVNFALAAPGPITIPVGGLSNTCKTAVATTVTVKPNFTSITNIQSCDSTVWNSNTYKTSGVYTFTAMGSNGCDSIATLNLTITHPTTSITNTSACDSLVWNGTTYTSTGVYTFSTINANNCDSIATINLRIDTTPQKPIVTAFTANITSPQTGVLYSCTTVANASSYIWTYTGTGVIFTNNGNATVVADFDVSATSGDMQVVALNGTNCSSIKDSVAVVVTPLPVKITNYELRITGKNQITNYWATATEINSKNFEIQRSFDGRNFETIGTVVTKGYASEYQFTDPLNINYLPPTIYYRLKPIDNDGKYIYSEVKIITTNNLPYVVSVFPNPTKGLVHIILPKDEKGNWDIKVQDAIGKVLQETTISPITTTLDLMVSRQSGVYYVTLINKLTNKKIVEKIVVE